MAWSKFLIFLEGFIFPLNDITSLAEVAHDEAPVLIVEANGCGLFSRIPLEIYNVEKMDPLSLDVMILSDFAVDSFEAG